MGNTYRERNKHTRSVIGKLIDAATQGPGDIPIMTQRHQLPRAWLPVGRLFTEQ